MTAPKTSQNDRAERDPVRAIAFHLPQFHPIPENDEWWGKGFTEWTNVAKARPLFPGHYQPHLPADLGFYDLRLPEARAAQAELAAEHGIYGFCYYHYWFNGRRVLERPIDDILKSGEPDFPFCLCWANENWTRRWDGMDDDILLEQRYSAKDDLAHIHALIPYLADPRYITIDGRPLFAVYRASKMPEPQRSAEIWRRESEREGLKGLFIARIESFDEDCDSDPRKIGFDASVEFQPRWSLLPKSRVVRRRWWHRHKLGTGEFAFRDNVVCDYKRLVDAALKRRMPEYPRVPCVCPGWDNTARRRSGAVLFTNSTPELYGRWLGEIVRRQRQRLRVDRDPRVGAESLLFINAWNEWAEGNHLEPCQRWGRAYLEVTRRVLSCEASTENTQLVSHAGG